MNTYNRAKEIQNVRTQLLPIWGGWEGFLFNAFNCMKAYSYSGERYGYYGYDASGERTYKMNLHAMKVLINEELTIKNFMLNDMTLYPNGYINVNRVGEYTKHYYADALRIASKIGSGFSGNLCDSADAIDAIYPNYLTDRSNNQYTEMTEELDTLLLGDEPFGGTIMGIGVDGLSEFCELNWGTTNVQETGLFYYHPDHLGSTGMVTDKDAYIQQGFLYAPFGEIIAEYGWQSPNVPKYAFNAKELDEENGMYYYSARYYAPPTFISRDPMFEKYPSISPYTYCKNNPIIFIDPDGERVFAYDKISKHYMKSYIKDQFGTTKMFRFTINNELKINKHQFNKAMTHANADQKILLQGLCDAINDNNVVKVKVNENSKSFNFSDPQFIGYNQDGIPQYNNNGGTVIRDGAGFTAKAPNISYYMIGINNSAAENETASTDKLQRIGKDDYVSQTTGKSPSSVFMHELLDEFLNFYSKGNVNTSSPQIDKVSYHNAALQNKGLAPRNGLDHEK